MPFLDLDNPNAAKPKTDVPVFGTGTGGRSDYLGVMGQQGQKRSGAQADYYATGQDIARGDEDRVNQSGWGDYLKQVALGQAGQSAAELQMGAGLDASIRSNAAMAGSARGGGNAVAAAQRQAMDQNAQQQLQVVGQQGVVRAQEQAQARAAYSQHIVQQRQQDLMARGMSAQEAQFQAQLEQQQHALNDQLQLGMEGYANQAGIAGQGVGGQLQGGANQIGAAAQAQNNQWQQNLLGGAVGAGAGVVGAGLVASDANDKMNMRPLGPLPPAYGGGDPFAYNDFVPSDEMLKVFHAVLDPSLANAQKRRGASGMGGSSSDAGGAPTSEEMASPGVATERVGASENAEPSDERLKHQKRPLERAAGGSHSSPTSPRPDPGPPNYNEFRGESDTFGTPASGRRIGREATEYLPGVAAREVSDRNDKRALLDLESRDALAALQRPMPRVAHRDPSAADIAEAMRHAPVARRDPGDTVPAGAYQTRDPRVGEALAALGGGYEPVARRDEGDTRGFEVSDRGDKRGLSSADAEPAQMMDTLRGYEYHYKPGVQDEDPRVPRFGPMAQDVAKTPMGASIVVHGPQGLELDTKHGFGVVLAALGNLNERMRSMEGGKRRTDRLPSDANVKRAVEHISAGADSYNVRSDAGFEQGRRESEGSGGPASGTGVPRERKVPLYFTGGTRPLEETSRTRPREAARKTAR